MVCCVIVFAQEHKSESSRSCNIQTIKQSTDASINQAIKQSISDAACVCVHVHVACSCSMCCVFVHVHPNQTQQTNQINHIKQTLAISNPHIHACVYHVCLVCVWNACTCMCIAFVYCPFVCSSLCMGLFTTSTTATCDKSVGTLVMEKNKHKLRWCKNST